MAQRDEGNAVNWDEFLTDLQAEQAKLPEDFRSGFVAVVGQPNVGKSTLINRIVGEKVAIVSSKPQTTRRRIRGILTRDDAQIIFVDTPGIHDAFHRLGEYMNEQALGTIPDADVVLFLVSATHTPDELDRTIAERVATRPVHRVLVINKIDLVEQEVANTRLAAYSALGAWDEVYLISAAEGAGVPGLVEALVAALPRGPLFYPDEQVSDQNDREMASEIIREAALRHLQQEVPHALNVQIDEWKARSQGKTYVDAVIYVERDSQKGIVIGRGGSMLKRISSAARKEIERVIGEPIYLEVRVKVRDKWRDDESWLNRWGYKPPKE